MEQRTYNGARLTPENVAGAIVEEWDRDQTAAQSFGDSQHMIVQIGQRSGGWLNDEPREALTLEIDAIPDGVRVTMGQQQWFEDQGGKVYIGGLVGFFPFFFTFPLGRLFGGGQETVDSSLPARVWQTIDRFAGRYGAATGATRRLAAHTCPDCGVANPQGAEYCSACGNELRATAGSPQCNNCGHINPADARFCNQCGTRMSAAANTLG